MLPLGFGGFKAQFRFRDGWALSASNSGLVVVTPRQGLWFPFRL